MLRIDRVSKHFGGITALDDVSFTVEHGEILGLIGPNGSGKSTVINIVSKLYFPSSGQVFFNDKPITGLPPHKVAEAGIARTFQLLRLFQGLTAFENVLTATHLAGSHGLLAALTGRMLTRHEEQRLREMAWGALEFVGLSSRANIPARALTAGEGRLLEIARALAAQPRLILLDEPAAGLNTAETAVLEEKLRTLQAQGHTLLLVDHHMQLVMGLVTRVIVLNGGKVLVQGTPSDVQCDSRVIEAYLGRGTLRRRHSKPSIAKSNGDGL